MVVVIQRGVLPALLNDSVLVRRLHANRPNSPNRGPLTIPMMNMPEETGLEARASEPGKCFEPWERGRMSCFQIRPFVKPTSYTLSFGFHFFGSCLNVGGFHPLDIRS